MGQGLRSCGCPTSASTVLGEGGAREARAPTVGGPVAAVVVPGGGSGDAASWAPPNAALVGSAGARLAARLDGSASTTWLLAKGCAVRLTWSSSSDQLGLGTPPVTLPDVPSLPARVVQVACGEAHTLLLALDPAPRVFAMGANDYGQLGLEDTRPRQNVARAFEVKALDKSALVGGVACGGNVSMAVSQRGDVWSWGCNQESGVLGLGTVPVACVPTPTPIGHLRRKVRAVQAATTGWTGLCLSHLGAVFSWGGGFCGVHGHGHQEDEPTAKAIRGLSEVAVVQVSAGLLHVLALSSRGEVFTWGRIAGAFGPEAQLQLTPKYVDALEGVRIVQVAAGSEHNLALSEAGEVYGWGAHGAGAMGGVPKLADRTQQYSLVHKLELNLGRVREIGCGQCHSLFWATTTMESDDALAHQRESNSLWICGQGAPPAQHPAAAQHGRQSSSGAGGFSRAGGGLSRGPLAGQAGTPLKLTRVDVKRILDMMAT